MPKLSLDEINELYNDSDYIESEILRKRKIRKEKKENNKRKVELFSKNIKEY